MKLSTFTNKTARATIEIDGEVLNLVVRPYLMTPERERMIGGLDDASEQMDAFLSFFCEYVESWDLTQDNGEPVKLLPDEIQAFVPSQLLVWIQREAAAQTSPLAPTSPAKRKR